MITIAFTRYNATLMKMDSLCESPTNTHTQTLNCYMFKCIFFERQMKNEEETKKFKQQEKKAKKK